MFEYGSRAGVWRLERLLTERKLPITFYACAVALERNPRGCRLAQGGRPRALQPRLALGGSLAALARGGARSHPQGDRVDPGRPRRAPSGWYCRYGPSVNTRELLVEEGGFVYDSDAYNDDLPYYVDVKGKQHLVVPYTLTYNDAKFGVLPSYGSPADFLDNLKRGFDQLWDEGETHPRMMSIGLHPRLIGQASRIHALREFLGHAGKKGGSLVRPAHRHRQLVERSSGGVRRLTHPPRAPLLREPEATMGEIDRASSWLFTCDRTRCAGRQPGTGPREHPDVGALRRRALRARTAGAGDRDSVGHGQLRHAALSHRSPPVVQARDPPSALPGAQRRAHPGCQELLCGTASASGRRKSWSAASSGMSYERSTAS